MICFSKIKPWLNLTVREVLLIAELGSETKPIWRNILNALVLNASCRMKWGRRELDGVCNV